MIEKEAHIKIEIINPKVTPTAKIKTGRIVYIPLDEIHHIIFQVPGNSALLANSKMEFDTTISMYKDDDDWNFFTSDRIKSARSRILQLFPCKGEKCDVPSATPKEGEFALMDHVIAQIEIDCEDKRIFLDDVQVDIIFEDDGIWAPSVPGFGNMDMDQLLEVLEPARLDKK